MSATALGEADYPGGRGEQCGAQCGGESEVGHLKYADFDLENLRLVHNFLTGRGIGQWQGDYRNFSLSTCPLYRSLI